MGDKENTKKGDSEEPKKRKVLFLSDAHIAGKTSNFAAYQASIIELMTHYDDVVMIGDNWELFFVDKEHVRSLSRLLEMLTGKDSHKWKKDFDRTGETKSGVENVVNGATWFTEEFLERFSKVHLHVVGGNHENVRRFRNEFDHIQAKHPNFEWSPSAIRIGDALATHGHLPMRGRPDEPDKAYRLRDAGNQQKWAGILGRFAWLDHKLHQRFRGTEKTAAMVLKQLRQWDGKDDFRVSHNRVHVPFSMDWVKHVFIGHTHIKCDNYAKEGGDALYHNTGAITQVASQKPEDLGILEADLEAGKITNVRPVKISRDTGFAVNLSLPGGSSIAR